MKSVLIKTYNRRFDLTDEQIEAIRNLYNEAESLTVSPETIFELQNMGILSPDQKFTTVGALVGYKIKMNEFSE